jgi:cell wall-associated NlpC family hydrolase
LDLIAEGARHTERVRPVIVTLIAALAFACAGCGQSAPATRGQASSARPAPAADSVPAAHPQAVEPTAGSGGTAVVQSPGQSSVSVGSGGTLPQPTSLEEIKQELSQNGTNADPNQATLTSNLLAIPPINAPAQVQAIINAGNEIAHLPYVWGGGHMTYEDNGYDCSGSISFVLAAAGLLKGTETAGQLMSYGDAGPGKWITIYASAGHTFMYIAGLRFDTVALAETGSRWSNRSADDGGAFVARHPPGL